LKDCRESPLRPNSRLLPRPPGLDPSAERVG
jgi:hypothetical protein